MARDVLRPTLQDLRLLCRGIAASRLKRLQRQSRVYRYRKGETLFREGQPAHHVWLLTRGWVYLVKQTPQGIPVTIATLTPEDRLCGYSAVVGRSAYFASAVAATETTAVCMSRPAFATLLHHVPHFAERVLQIYHVRMGRLAEMIALAQAPVEQRLAHTLLRLRETFGTVIPVTHSELSRMAGTRWETSIRHLSGMKRRGWVASRRGQVTVKAPAQLRRLLRGTKPAYAG
jgi:CRP-like cAMP-binding protein